MASDLNRLEFDFLQASVVAAHQASRIVVKTGHDVVRDAQAFCPVKTGNLRSSTSVDFRYNGLEFEAGPTAQYGIFVELGTSRMGPHAFLGPAFDRNVPGAVTALTLLGATLIGGTGR